MPEVDDNRIARLYRRDCIVAVVMLVALWLTIAFVFAEIWTARGSGDVRTALAVGAAFLLLLNTASIVALLRHYTMDKVHLYGLDLFYLDATRAAKREARLVR